MRRRREMQEKGARMPLIAKILMCVGIATLVYLFITEVLMRILAALTTV